MVDPMPYINQTIRYINTRLPQYPRQSAQALARTLPTVRLLAQPDMVEALTTSRMRAIDTFWERSVGLQSKLGHRRAERMHPALFVAYLTVTCPVSCSYALTAALCTGLKATYEAVVLARKGQTEAARDRIKENAFEVFCLLRLVENAALLGAAIGIVRLARAATPLPRWLP